MSASYTYLLDTGTISIDTVDLLTDVETEWKNAFGATLNVDASTAQGTMIAAETTARTSVMKNNADLANMMNPNLAYKLFLDAVCALLGIERGTNQSTVAQGVQMQGDPGTVIVSGSRIQTPNGDMFDLVDNVTIPSSGNGVGVFQSEAYGAIPFPTGAMTIIDGTIGWGAVAAVDTTTVTAGSSQNTDPQLKNKRNQQLAVQGTGSAAAVRAALLNVPNVTSVQVVENNTGIAQEVNGVTFTKPSALWVCVAGNPSPAAVAAAMYAAHNSGCPWDYGSSGNGNPVQAPNGVTTTDPNTGLPYQVLYTTPIMYDAYINIQVRQTEAQSPGTGAIQKTILSYAQGQEDGELGFVVGVNGSVSAFEVSGSVVRNYPGLYVKSCMVAVVPQGSPAPAYPADYVYEWAAGQFDQADLQIGNINVVAL
jgi:hypothetical protein